LSTPKLIVLFCEEQWDAFNSVRASHPHATVFHFDATGSLLKEHKKRVLLYSLCAYIQLPNIKALPLLEFLSDRHDAKTIKTVLDNWRAKSAAVYCSPSYIVSDMSWALLKATAESFNGLSLKEQLNAQWLALTDESSVNVFLRFCVNHFVHLITRKIAHIPIKTQVFILVNEAF